MAIQQKKMAEISRWFYQALFALSLAIPLGAHADDTGWTLEQDENRIRIYSRPVTGSPFLEVKAVALINAPIVEVVTAMGDGNGCSAWRAMCKSSEILSAVSDTEQYVYLVLDLPWPVADRDMVIHSIAHIDAPANTVMVQLESASSKHPEKDYVRATSNGMYQIAAIDEEQVELTYILHTDLGGDLSADLINPRVTASTFDDVKRLQAMAEKR